MWLKINWIFFELVFWSSSSQSGEEIGHVLGREDTEERSWYLNFGYPTVTPLQRESGNGWVGRGLGGQEARAVVLQIGKLRLGPAVAEPREEAGFRLPSPGLMRSPCTSSPCSLPCPFFSYPVSSSRGIDYCSNRDPIIAVTDQKNTVCSKPPVCMPSWACFSDSHVR